MRIAVISDMHGNNLAFERVLADIKQRGVDQIVCLGDAIQGGPQPRETVENLRALNCPVVMGNADTWMLTGVETSDDGIPPERLNKMGQIRLWSLSQLSEEDRTFIANFKPTITIPLGDNLDLLCFHGSPTSFDDILLPDAPDETVHKYLGVHADKILTGGHTHAQQIRRNGDLFFFNPGSVGLPYNQYQPDGKFHVANRADYAIFTMEGGQTSLEFRRLPLDLEKIIRVYHESGRPFAEDAIAQYQ
jgi:putative phosphoesterase